MFKLTRIEPITNKKKERAITDKLEGYMQKKERAITDKLEGYMQKKERAITDKLEGYMQKRVAYYESACAVSSALDRSKRFILYHLADLFIPTPTRLLWKAF